MSPIDPTALPRLGAQALQAWSTAVLQACGVPADAAALAARVLVRTSLRGIACEAQRLAEGVPVPPGLQAELRLLGERVGQPLPATRS